jgi:hypothetical protein
MPANIFSSPLLLFFLQTGKICIPIVTNQSS